MSTRPYLYHDASALDIEFYRGFDERFLERKAHILFQLLSHPELLKQVGGEDLGRIEQTVQAIATELHCSELHQFETYFALLLAPFQLLPHWVFLTTYRVGWIKEKVSDFLAGRIGALTHDCARTMEDFIESAICLRTRPEGIDPETWSTSLGNLRWLTMRMARKYIEGGEYNAYKHGLRVSASEAGLFVQTAGAPQLVLQVPYSITHLVLDDVPEGRRVSVETKGISPRESLLHVQQMARVIGSMKNVRLAVLTGDPKAQVATFESLDRAELESLTTVSRWKFSR